MLIKVYESSTCPHDSGTDEKARIIPKVVMSLAECLEYIKEDELVEVTPKSMRMRKVILDHDQRKKANKQ
jgi:GTP-binding protein